MGGLGPDLRTASASPGACGARSRTVTPTRPGFYYPGHASGYECVALWYGGQVDIFPVNYGLDGDGILFRSNAGRKMSGAGSSEVAFEVDNIDTQAKSRLERGGAR